MQVIHKENDLLYTHPPPKLSSSYAKRVTIREDWHFYMRTMFFSIFEVCNLGAKHKGIMKVKWLKADSKSR